MRSVGLYAHIYGLVADKKRHKEHRNTYGHNINKRTNEVGYALRTKPRWSWSFCACRVTKATDHSHETETSPLGQRNAWPRFPCLLCRFHAVIVSPSRHGYRMRAIRTALRLKTHACEITREKAYQTCARHDKVHRANNDHRSSGSTLVLNQPFLETFEGHVLGAELKRVGAFAGPTLAPGEPTNRTTQTKHC